MYHLFTRGSDGVLVNRWDGETLQAVKVYADQYWPHAECLIRRSDTGEIVTRRSAEGSWQ